MEKKQKTPKILITGWLGYIWSHTAIVFAQAWYDLVIVDNLSNSQLDVLSKIKELTKKTPSFYDDDLQDAIAIKKILSENRDIEWIIHFAGKKAIEESCENPFMYYQNNITGTMNLIEAMRENNIKNIVFSSTAAVYDAEKLLPPFSENDNLNPQNPYATSKLVIEKLLKDMSKHKRFNSIVLRYFNPIWAHHSWIIGEDPKGIPNNLVPVIFKVVQNEIPTLKIFGNDYDTPDGTGVRDYLHVVDLAEAHLLAFQYINEFISYEKDETNPKGLYDIFNLWTSKGHSVKERRWLLFFNKHLYENN